MKADSKIDPQSPGTSFGGENNKLADEAKEMTEVGFIDEIHLLRRLPVSRRTLFNWRRSGKIPYVRLGGRRILFHWPSVETALLRHQRGGNQ